jgi:hypothetical protein
LRGGENARQTPTRSARAPRCPCGAFGRGHGFDSRVWRFWRLACGGDPRSQVPRVREPPRVVPRERDGAVPVEAGEFVPAAVPGSRPGHPAATIAALAECLGAPRAA